MDVNSIMNTNFTEAMRGYKKEEVDDFLSDLSAEFTRVSKEKEELEAKLAVCADKIREYREDEDALKAALFVAQKQAKAIVAEAEEKAAGIVAEAEEKSELMIKEAEDNVAERNAEAEKIKADALAEKARIEAEAKKAADDLHTEMMIQNEIDKEVLARTKREAEDFRTRIIVEYTNHIEFIKNIPEQCVNEFVKETTANHDTDILRELIASQNGTTIPELNLPVGEEAAAPEEEEDIKVVDSFADIPVAEAASEEIEEEAEEAEEIAEAAQEAEQTDEEEDADEEEEESYGGFTVENAFGDDDEDDIPEKATPSFLITHPGKNKSKFEKLEFSNNHHNGKKKKR